MAVEDISNVVTSAAFAVEREISTALAGAADPPDPPLLTTHYRIRRIPQGKERKE
ncbi:MAG: hypothetical protein ACXWW2_06125 [Candidatus Deferrimicrobiaceae bacterium]